MARQLRTQKSISFLTLVYFVSLVLLSQVCSSIDLPTSRTSIPYKVVQTTSFKLTRW
ncbi:hypothetical protein Pint_20309 [Pistacia integerrima]|uniref:Uncharacterized protein n=1 Tax=Pistacia integerrima TaxID=434235 RepID=A0ACC0X8A7_9ROSI|nr:hypothetical protein Pint_20309 [Pistacia integerrima]